jgi:hypothetical protein
MPFDFNNTLNNKHTSKLCMQTLLDTTLTVICEECLELFSPSRQYIIRHKINTLPWLCSDKCRREWGLESKRLWYVNNKDALLTQRRTHYNNNHESIRAQHKIYRNNYKMKTFEKVGRGKLSCVYCGCDYIPALQINHKNGDGARERIECKNYSYTFYRKIRSGERLIDDLELTCGACNWIYYETLKHGLNIGGWYEVKFHRDIK